MYDAFFSSTLIMAETWSVVNFTINGREDLKGIHITSILGSVCTTKRKMKIQCFSQPCTGQTDIHAERHTELLTEPKIHF